MKYIKRDAIKNYFPLPNEVFCLGLTYGELAVYSYLMYCENRKTFKCYPSYKTIGNAIGMSKNTVRKYVKSLEDNKEFRSVKNMIIKAAVEIMQTNTDENYTRQTITNTARNLAKALCLLISQSYTKKLSRLNKQIDSKLKSKIEQKKAAHGLKTDYSVIVSEMMNKVCQCKLLRNLIQQSKKN